MTIENVSINLIDDNPYQPRSSYSTNKIAELTHSIKEIGLRQKPEARPVDGRYQLAYGHLRKRAFAKLIKEKPKDAHPDTLHHIRTGTMPLEVKDITDKEMVEYAIEENLRRDDITPMDVARTIELYLNTFEDESETSAGKKFNMTQGNVSNMLRVLKCPGEVLEKIDGGKINFTMARELLIFQDKRGVGKEQKYSHKEGKYIDIPKDDTWLMLEAIRGVGGQYGPAATVDGIKKSIFNVCHSNFKHLEREGGYYSYQDKEPLFDTRAAGCLKCEHMVKAYETKTQARHFCTNPKCWEKKQEQHKKKQAVEAKKKMEEDIIQRAAVMESNRAATEEATAPISQEIPAPAESVIAPDILDVIPEEEREEARKRLEHLKPWPNYPCHTCLNVGHCDGTGVYSVSGTGASEVSKCDDYMGKADAKDVRKKAAIKVPDSVKELVKEKAGSRAEILDLRELRCGSYNNDLKTGYVLLNSGFNSPIEMVEDPAECTDRCTRGFHYAFDSDPHGHYLDEDEKAKVYFVCTDPKCVARKKAAFTRAKNAAGMAKKKAEFVAIKEAVIDTTRLDKARMKLILHSELFHKDGYYFGERDKSLTWFCKMLSVSTKEADGRDTYDRNVIRQRLYEAVDKATEEELAKLLVEYYLLKLTYDGEINNYKVLTTEPLNWMGIGVNVPKPEKKDTTAPEPEEGVKVGVTE